MSAYRHITSKGTSFSATYSYNYQQWKELCGAFIEYADKAGNLKIRGYAEFMYMRNIYMAVKYKKLGIWDAIKETNALTRKVKSFMMCVVFIFNKRVLKKTVQI